jgi:hypothetical protein
MNTPREQPVLAAAMQRLLRPLVRILLRHGVSFHTFAQWIKRAYVEVAMAEFALPGKKPTVSRVSLLSGLTRKEVRRVLTDPALAAAGIGADERYNRVARVITGWARDAEFCTAAGRPRVLAIDEERNGFVALVRRYSGDIPARAVLDELVRVGAVAPLSGARVRLLKRSYVPNANDHDMFGILGNDVADLIGTIDHNLQHGQAQPYYQRKVMYDNLPRETLSELRAQCAANSQALLEQLDRRIARRDRDVNPEVRGTGRARVGIGIYYFEEVVQSPLAGD